MFPQNRPAAAGIAWITISKARGEDPLNDFTRFYAAVLFFLVLLLARLAPMFCTLEFNVGWWAYVFPLGSAATMTILLNALYTDNIAMLAFAWIGFIATTTLLVITASLTVKGFVKGEIPKSPDSLQTYYHIEQFKAAMAETASSVDGSEDNAQIL